MSYQKYGGDRFARPNFKRSRPRRSFGEKIDISQFIQKSKMETEVVSEVVSSKFSDFSFSQPILENLKQRNYLTPTSIQNQTIPYILAGKDVIGLANTGTGKTGAFLLPLIEKVYQDRSQNVLIIAPTRELAQQIESEFRQFSWGMKIFSATCVGGLPIYKQITMLRYNPNFIIGTPGRLGDLSKRNAINFGKFQNVVIDEVDRMLDMGFIEDIKMILRSLPSERQSLFFCATLPTKITSLVASFMKNPITVNTVVARTTKNVEQDVIRIVSRESKFNQLQDLLNKTEVAKTLIFVETKREVEKVTSGLVGTGFRADSIHGDKRQSQRQKALDGFRNNRFDVLVATDVAARGLDIKDVTHVVNYTIPQTYDDYVHRIGRAGRGNSKGMAYTFVG